MVVGAEHESSNGVGVNPPSQADNSADRSGAAYVFDIPIPCTAGVELSYLTETNRLRIDYTVGNTAPAFFLSSLLTTFGAFPLIATDVPVISPPADFPIEFPLPPIGAVGAFVYLSDGSPGGTCFDLGVVDTGGAGLTVSEAKARTRRQVEALRRR